MTNIIKRKNLLFLMVIAIMVAMMSVACKNKATVSTSLSGEMPIDLTQDVSQFEGKTFKSVEVLKGTGYVPIYLWVKISENSTIKYKGDIEQNADFSKNAETIVVRGLGQNYVFTGKSDKGVAQNASLKFDSDGTLTINFIDGTSYNGQTIKCKLVK